MRPDHLLFMHIPKTAGSTVHSMLGLQFPKRRQLIRNMVQHTAALENLSAAQREELRLVRGHFPHGLHHFFTGSTEYTTLLREPVDRCISHYYYLKGKRDALPQDDPRSIRHSLAELCSNGEFLFVDNLQVRYLSGNAAAPFGQVNETMFRDALKNLEAFPVIGIQREFDAYMLLLADRYRFRFPYYRRQRVNAERPSLQEVDEATRTAVATLNRWDGLLYDAAAARVQQLIAEKGEDFRSRLQRYRKRNRWVEAIANALPFFPKAAGAKE